MSDSLTIFASVLSVNIGRPAAVIHKGKEIMTGIHKRPVGGEVYLGLLNMDGDGQADLEHHGGPDKAVCVYPAEHFAYWERESGRKLGPGAFGENLTTQGLLEDDVCIGDAFRLGQALVQVTQPRQPCYKLSVKYDWPKLPLLVQQTGYTGYYFRVLEEGRIPAGGRLILLDRERDAVPVSFANVIMHHDKHNREGIERLLALTSLSASWRKTMIKRREGVTHDTAPRLQGT